MSDPALPRLAEHYELGAELGRGGFGVVLAGRRRRDGTPVAVKLPHEPPAPDDLERIQREARLLTGRTVPQLVGFHGLFQDERGELALVYDLVEGTDLAQCRRAPLPELKAWIADVAAGLASLHEAGLVHRDVKPENVRVTPAGRAVLLDFGMLRPAQGETVTATGMLLGTPGFLAPEQIRAGRAGPPADVYALGCVVYEMLEGVAPYRGDLHDVLAAQLAGLPAPPRSGAGQAAWPLVQRMLAPDPAARPGAAEVPALLDEALREVPERPAATVNLGAAPAPVTRARLRPTPRRGQPSRKSRRVPPRRLVAGLFLAATLGAFLVHDPEPAPPPSPPPEAPAAPEPLDWEKFFADLDGELDRARGLHVDARGELVPEDGDLGALGVAPLLEPDPARFPFVVQHMPLLAACFEWLGTDPILPHQLHPAVRRRVQAYEDRFASGGMPRPFYPAMELAPAPTPYVVPPGLREHVAARVLHYDVDPLPEALAGWTALAAAEAWRLQRSFERIEAETMATLTAGRLPDGFEDVSRFYVNIRDHQKMERFVREVGETPELRTHMLRWNRPEQEAYLRVLLAIGRGLEAREPGADAIATYLRERIRDWSLFQTLALRPAPDELLVGGRLTRPITRAFLVSLLDNLYSLRLEWHIPRDAWQRRCRRWLEEAEGEVAIPPGDAPLALEASVWVSALSDILDDIEDGPAYLAFYRRWLPRFPRLPVMVRRTLVVRMGEAQDRGPLVPPPELAALRALACRLLPLVQTGDREPDRELAAMCAAAGS